MPSHIVTSSKYDGRSYNVHCHNMRRQTEELSNRKLIQTSCRSTSLALLCTKYSQDHEVHLVSRSRSDKYYFHSTSTFHIIWDSFLLYSVTYNDLFPLDSPPTVPLKG